MALLVTDETPRPTRHVRPNGEHAYTVMSIGEIDALPYYHLCALSEAIQILNPVGYYFVFPREFLPLSLI